jgi:uncharacterized protein (TIGR00288 family)
VTSQSVRRGGRPQAAIPSHHLSASAPIHHAPNAALLIDFDNVTLGVRSDLAKELRTLLNSDIIKGKVAVQRAYADWRRYPQYIVSLSESSIDLIFAPAFGTNKKNATDIRLAVDATELVFTRPEIGTFILLSGDSDFSSLVLKLKEYGKYVIGVGIRESASDILIQNCDEYYSYSDLAGLSKESEDTGPPRDPWELVVVAVAQMTQNRDVMRADRLKQVMQQLDSSFDESNAGFNRFSKFVTEAGTRGLIKVIKQENGQLDVAIADGTRAAAPAARPARGGRAAVTATPAPAPTPAVEAKDPDARPSRRRRGGRGRGRAGGAEEGAAAGTPTVAPSVRAAAAATGLTLAEAFHLLSRALGELPAPVPHETLRARMASMHGKEDALLEPARFIKLLRQANDAEIADVRLLGDNQYEISQHKSDLAFQKRAAAEPAASVDGAATPAPRAPAALRFRGGSRSSTRHSDVAMVGVVDFSSELAPDTATPTPTSAAATPATVITTPAAKATKAARGKRAVAKTKEPAATKPAPAGKAKAAAKSATPSKPSKPRVSKPRAG